MLFKVDVARSFSNLSVDPADGLKFGITWKDAFYLDPEIAFGRVHGSADSFGWHCLYYDTEKKEKLHCYMDNYTAVVPKVKADFTFNTLCKILIELGLPLNDDKLIPTPGV